MKTLAFYLLFFFFWLPTKSVSQIVINEVCSKNASVIEDEFGETPDWIELYNNTNTSINLEGYFISDDKSNPQKWTFPNKIIPPQNVLLIFASGND